MLIRMKFEIDSLVNEILDKLPNEVWNDPNHTFLDPSAGGGQFLKEIERRLLNAGHSKENIHSRVFGFFDSVLELNYAKNKHNLNSNLYIADISTIKNIIARELHNMKFDIVVGNPPFQPPVINTGDRKGSGNKLWPKFIELSFEITHEKSYISLITPSNWRTSNFSKGQAFEAAKLMWDYNIDFVKDVSSEFGGIASQLQIDSWGINRSIKCKKTDIFEKIKFLPIKSKNIEQLKEFFMKIVADENCFEMNIKGYRDEYIPGACIEGPVGDSNHPYKHINTFSQMNKGLYHWYSRMTPGFNDKKVIVCNSVNINVLNNKIAIYDDGNTGCGHNCAAFTVSSEEEGIKLTNYLNNSSIIKDLIKEYNGPNGYAIPYHLLKKIPKDLI